MDTSAFEPSLRVYVEYFLGFCLRYFGLAGALFWILHVRFKRSWAAYRIQESFPGRGEIGHEIRWSLVNAASTGLATLLTYALVHQGRTRMYFGLDEYGYAYLVLSAALCVLGYDAWNYWQHRFLHTDFMFRHVHWVHHRVGNPTAFATFAAHPIETFMGNAFFVLFVVYVPIHPLALAAAGAYLFAYGTLCHLGYEFFPRWVPAHPILGWLNNATYHNIHHSKAGCNFAGWFLHWDRLMGTGDRRYPETFDAVVARRATS